MILILNLIIIDLRLQHVGTNHSHSDAVVDITIACKDYIYCYYLFSWTCYYTCFTFCNWFTATITN